MEKETPYFKGMEPENLSSPRGAVIEEKSEKDPDDDCPVCGGTGSCMACEAGRKRTAAFKEQSRKK